MKKKDMKFLLLQWTLPVLAALAPVLLWQTSKSKTKRTVTAPEGISCRAGESQLGYNPLDRRPSLPVVPPPKTIDFVVRITRARLALAVLYLNKAEARDKICGVIQYGSKWLSNGMAGTAENVDKTASLAKKFFRLFKFLNGVNALISPTPQGTPRRPHFLGNVLLTAYLFLDQIVWLHKTGIYKNEECAEWIERISLICWMGSSMCTVLSEQESKDGTLDWLTPLVAAMDVVVAAGLLQWVPTAITPRVTGGFGFSSSLISCYQLLPSPTKEKST